MKSGLDRILRRAQAEYLDSLVAPRDALLERMERFASESNQPIADPEVAQLIRIIARLVGPARVLEVGTNIGYSVIVIGRECGSSTVIESIEIDPTLIAKARSFIDDARLAPKVVIHEGAALEVLATLDGPFDFVFIDCVKTEYSGYLELVKPKLSPGAVIVCDNLLWKGQVAEGARTDADIESTAAIARFNGQISNDPDLITTILPLGDGVGISVLK